MSVLVKCTVPVYPDTTLSEASSAVTVTCRAARRDGCGQHGNAELRRPVHLDHTSCPVMLAVLVSVAAMLWLPLLSRVTLNTCMPASAAVNV